MRIQFLGTAAAEAIPALFCDCEACRYARKTGGKEIRTRCAAVIDNRLLLDFGPDSYFHAIKYQVDYSKMHSLLITHTHEDHFQPTEIGCRRPICAHLPEDEPPLTVYGNETLGKMLAPYLSDMIAYHPMAPFRTVEIEGYSVTPLEAVHCLRHDGSEDYPVVFEGKTYARSENALFYLIEKDGESILYANDTDEFTPADMEFLAGRKIGIIALDCTNGGLDCDYIGHMGINDNLRLRDQLLAIGAADENTVFVANHFSHNGILPYEELQRRLPGFEVSYDGMILETVRKEMKPDMHLESDRLTLRRITQEDFDSWYAILSDPETMKYYPAPYDRAGVQRWVDWTLGNYERYGFGLWALILKETGEFIGDCGITMQNIHGQQLPEIGYHIHRRFHRKGYGSEAAAKVRDFAFENWDFPALYSYMNSENAASYGVAIKNGMRLVDEYTADDGENLKVYCITREEWQRIRNDA